MPAVFSRENLRAGLREPGPALGVLFALLRGRWYRFKYRLRGVRLTVGRNFRCHGRLVIAGRGTVVIGDDVVFRTNLRHVYLGSGSAGYRITIGDKVWLHGTAISCRERVEIGAGCLVGRVEIIDHEFHDPRDDAHRPQIRSRPVLLGPGAWIGNDALILKGVEIGEHAVVGARTVVRRSLPARVLAIGNPARVVKNL
ncbi:MAG: acyltransferase [Planctomycetes bacterium]|nr:acyltransferase [Planctomycetota bacterium]